MEKIYIKEWVDGAQDIKWSPVKYEIGLQSEYTKTSDIKQALRYDRSRYQEYLNGGHIEPQDEMAYDLCRDVINNLDKIITQLEDKP